METEALNILAQSLSEAQKWTSRIEFDLSEAGDCSVMVNLMDAVKNKGSGKWFGFEYPSFFFRATEDVALRFGRTSYTS
jgi:hypothetical protein